MGERLHEPVAIVGMACRLPSIAGPADLWAALREGRDALPGGDGDGLDAFDAQAFGISPREAAAIDPQQGLALELAWQGLDDAGIPLEPDARAPAGVFLGVMADDYAGVVRGGGERAISSHSLTGTRRSVIANRVSYRFGFSGPSVTVDTGQSSSLVAVHMACASLRTGECELALAGGVNLILSDVSTLEADRIGALSPDGRCFTFDARANGYARGQGGGLVVLKPLSRALADGDRIHAVIRGSAVNAGADAAGLTVPSEAAQADVIERALRDAGVDGDAVQYVELHGTGTPVGDPVEAAALGRAYGAERASGALAVGSVKTNVGHLEGAAGIAGLIKAALCVERRELVPSLNYAEPNPDIPLDRLGLRVVTETETWPAGDRPLVAGVSSFGMGGANAHLLLEEAPRTGAEAAPEPGWGLNPWLVSANDEATLREHAAELHAHLGDHSELEPLDVSFTLATRLSGAGECAVALGRNRGELLERLEALSRGEAAAGIVQGTARPRRVAFVFPGQGSQWQGMGLELWRSLPAFAERMEACERALSSFVDWSLEGVLRGDDAGALDRVDVIQPALFAVMVSLAGTWRDAGVEPSAVVGHSQGEIAAAHVAGALTLEDAARTVALRSQLVAARLAGRGGMVSIAMPAARALELAGDGVSLAAVNGPSSAVLSGEPELLDEIVARCEAQDVRARRIPVDYASHSAHVEEIRDDLLRALGPIRPRAAGIPLRSTLTGEYLDGSELDAEYWYRNLREPVQFESAVRALADDGCDAFVEASPHPVLTVAIAETAGADDAAAIGSLRRDEGGLDRFVASLAEAHVQGVRVDWRRVVGRGRRVELPAYPFRRRRWWEPAEAPRTDVAGAGLEAAGHPLLAAAVDVAGEDRLLLTGSVSPKAHPWLADHVVLDEPVAPASLLIELALAAGARAGCGTLEELTVEAPLALPEEGSVAVQVGVSPADGDGRREVAVFTRPDAPGTWHRHAHGFVSAAEGQLEAFATWPPAGATRVDVEHVHDRLAEFGFAHGSAFAGLRAAWRRDDDVFAEVALPADRADDGFLLHPALLDAALQPALERAGEPGTLPLLVTLRGMAVASRGVTALRVALRAPAADGTFSVAAADEAGAPVFSIRSLSTRALQPSDLQSEWPERYLHRVEWEEVAPRARVDASSDALDAVLTPVESSADAAERALSLVQECLADERRSKLAFVTQGAVGTDPDPAQAAVWGLVRAAQAEHPGRFVLIDRDDDEPEWSALIATGEPELCVRAGRVLAPRVVRVEADQPDRRIDTSGTVLIAGTASDTLERVALHLVREHGAERLVLVAPDADRLAAGCRELGASVTVIARDPAEPDALAGVEHPLTAAIYVPAPSEPCPIDRLTPDALRGQVDAAALLDERTEDCELVLVSSALGTIAAPGSAASAAAAAHLDALAARRAARGLEAKSLAWLPEGDAPDGLVPLSLEPELLDAAYAAAPPAVLALRPNLASLRARARAGSLPPVLRTLAGPVDAPEPTSVLAARLEQATAGRFEIALELVRSEIAALLGHDSIDAVGRKQTFKDLGVDSPTILEFRKRLERATALRLPASLVFDHPTPAAVAQFVLGELDGEPTGEDRDAPLDPGLIDEMDVNELVRMTFDQQEAEV